MDTGITLVQLALLFFTQGSDVQALTTSRTLFTFYNSFVPWKVASRKCSEFGTNSTLINIDTESKADLIKRLHLMEPWVSLTAVNYWIGLHNIDPSVNDFRWTRSCARLGIWTNWHNGEPRNDTDYYCARNMVSDCDWKMYDCTASAPFICEDIRDEDCFFKLISVNDYPHSNASIGLDIYVKHVLYNGSVKCDIRCLTSTINGSECWAWYTDDDYCVLFYSNKILFPETSANSSAPQLFVKDCYAAGVDTTTVVSYTLAEIVNSPNLCPTSTTDKATTTTLTTSTTELLTTEPQTMTTTTIPTTDKHTTEGTLTTTTSPKTTEAETTTPITMIQLTTPLTTTTAKPVVVAFECDCFCDNVTAKEPAPTLSPKQKEQFVVQIVKSLTINISSISATRRKLTSAYDSRTSARHVGVIGISLISIAFSCILILDVPGLALDFRKLFRNVKSGLGYESVGEADKKL